MTRVAIADDDDDTREIVRRALQAPDVSIVEASSGGELVELLAADDACDLLITDITMPWISGLQVLVSARTAGFATPALVITGLSDPSLSVRVAALGRARLLRKPFGIDELRRAVAALLAPPSTSGEPCDEPDGET